MVKGIAATMLLAMVACCAVDEDEATTCAELCDWNGDGRADVYRCDSASGPCVCWPDPDDDEPIACDPAP